MNTPQISVIVPVYNAEKTIEKCLSSICNQTFKDLEIIVINDGSTDNSYSLCEGMASADKRIRLVTQTNSGRSYTRNKGLELATGEWIGFVDSDDWIEANMYERLHTVCTSQHAEIAQCSYFFNDNKLPKHRAKGTFGHDEALELLFRDKEIKNFLWNNLFHRSLFSDVRFPEHKNFEDVAVMFRLFDKASRIICIDESLYHYCTSDTSIVRASFSIENKLDYLEALNAQYHFAQSKGLWKGASTTLTKKYMGVIDECLRNDASQESISLIAGFLRHNVNGTFLLLHSPYRALRRWLCLHCFGLYRLLTTAKKK